MSFKKLISHTVIIGSLLLTTPTGASTVSTGVLNSKHIHSLANAINKNSKMLKQQHRWFEPLLNLPNRSIIICILYAESRSTLAHPNLGDTNPYQYGPFQFTPILWNRWSWVAKVGTKSRTWHLGTLDINAVTIPAYRATLYQQAAVFSVVVKHDGFTMWTRFDGC